MLKDQCKWKKNCDLAKLGSLKRFNPDSEEQGDEGMGVSGRPEGRKAVQRKGREKPNNTIVDLVTNHFKELSTNNTKLMQIFRIWSP